MGKIYRNREVLWRDEDDALADAYRGLNSGDDVTEVATSILFAGGEVVALNVLGTEVWKLCDGRDADSIVAELLKEFEVPEDTLKADVADFLAELKEKGFLSYGE